MEINKNKLGMKITKILTGTILVAVLFAACEKDKDNAETNITLTCKGQTVDDYLLWAGSSSGGQQVNTQNISLKKVFRSDWIEDLDEITEEYTNTSISFNNDNVTFQWIDKVQTGKYYFRNDSLYLKRDGRRDYMVGVGNRNKIVIRDGFIHIAYDLGDVKGTSTRSAGEFQQRFTLNDGLKMIGFESLNQMNPGDTIAIYNVSYIFEVN